MSKERLSKIQRWILTATYRYTVQRDKVDVGFMNYGQEMHGGYFEAWVYEKYYRISHWHGEKRSYSPGYNKAHVSVCRSVRNLAQKGLIKIQWHDGRCWTLTDKGINVVNDMLSVVSNSA